MRDMVIAWVFTIPVAAAIGFVVFQLTVLPGVLAYVATAVAIVALVIYAVILMRGAMTAEDVAEELPSEAELVGAA